MSTGREDGINLVLPDSDGNQNARSGDSVSRGVSKQFKPMTQNRSQTKVVGKKVSRWKQDQETKDVPLDKPEVPEIFDENNKKVTPIPMLKLLTVDLAKTFEDVTEKINRDLASIQEHSARLSNIGKDYRDTRDLSKSLFETKPEYFSVLDHSGQIASPPDPEVLMPVVLKETETIYLLSSEALCIEAGTEAAEECTRRNENYTKLCNSREGNDLYVTTWTLTINEAHKSKGTQTELYCDMSTETQASNWRLYDEYQAIAEREKNISKSLFGEQRTGNLYKDEKDKFLYPRGITGFHRIRIYNGDDKMEVVHQMDNVLPEFCWQDHPYFEESITWFERLLVMNTQQNRLALYQKSLVNNDESQTDGQMCMFERLWFFTYPESRNRDISCITYNHDNTTVLAVSYCQFKYNPNRNGLVCCWSLKNPYHPEREYILESGVFSVAFSRTRPNLLACGCSDGHVYIFDVSRPSTQPVYDSGKSPNGHMGPVRMVKWLQKESISHDGPSREVLLSIGEDGNIFQWTLGKTLDSTVCLTLKKVPTRLVGGRKDRKQDSIITSLSSGYSFDFYDSSTYLVSTEEGHVHKCSIAYNDQYLSTFFGHIAPVYKVQFSPFVPEVFFSASADWDLCIWHIEKTHPIITLNIGRPVLDAEWSPHNSLILAVAHGVTIEIWNLSASTIDPWVMYKAVGSPDLQCTCLKFTPDRNTILIGDSCGTITIFNLKNSPPAPEDQENALLQILRGNVYWQLSELKKATSSQT